MIRAVIGGMILGVLLSTLIWGVLRNEQRMHSTLECTTLSVYYVENGLLYELGKSKVCITGTDFVVADVIWPPGQEVR